MKKRKSIIIDGYMKRIEIGIVVSLIIVIVICLIKSNYRNIEAFSNVLFYIGAAEVSAGGISLMGNTLVRGDVTYQLSRTSTDESSQKRTDKDIDSTEQRYNFAIYMSIVGALIIGFSVVTPHVLL